MIMESTAQNPTENTQPDATFFGVTVPKFDLPKFDLPKFDLPKFDLPKFDLSKFDLPKFDRPQVDFTALNDLAGVVKNAASDSVLAATQTATKVRNSATHTVTLVREAVGV
jgi:hypothetical protein